MGKDVAKVVVYAVGDLVSLLQKWNDEKQQGVDTIVKLKLKCALNDHHVVTNLFGIARFEDIGGAIRKKCLEPLKILCSSGRDKRSDIEYCNHKDKNGQPIEI